MTKKETEKLETAERELARLKLRLEIIRTICPILAIALQVIILVRVFQRSTWNNPRLEFLGLTKIFGATAPECESEVLF